MGRNDDAINFSMRRFRSVGGTFQIGFKIDHRFAPRVLASPSSVRQQILEVLVKIINLLPNLRIMPGKRGFFEAL